MNIQKLFIILLLFIAFSFYAGSVMAQPVSQSSLIKNVAAVPTNCVSSDKNQRFIFSLDTNKPYICVGGVYSELGVAEGAIESSSYATVGAVKTAAASNRRIVRMTSNLTCTGIIQIPATLSFEALGGLITKGTGCQLQFLGTGIKNPMSDKALFSGFAAGDVTFTGTNEFPKEISDLLWNDAANTKVNIRLMKAVKAIAGHQATVVTHPGDIDGGGTITEGLSVHFTSGYYSNSADLANNGINLFIIESNVRIHGDGQGRTIIRESLGSSRIFYTSGSANQPFSGFNKNIIVEDITFEGNPAAVTDSSTSTVNFGNCHDCYARRNTFDRTHGYAIFAGSFTYDSSNAADRVYIVDNVCIGLVTQQIGTTGGRNIFIERNIFHISPPADTGTFVAAIDIEPNIDSDGSDNLQINNNIFDGRLAQSGWNAIKVDQSYSGAVRNVRVDGNIIIGASQNVVTFHSTDVNVDTNIITSSSHGLQTGQNVFVRRDNNGNGGAVPGGLTDNALVYVIHITTNTIKFASTKANADAGIAIDITDQGESGIVYQIIPMSWLSNGIMTENIDTISITNNTVIRADQAGIKADGGYGMNISNNNVWSSGINTQGAIVLDSVSNSDVIGNLVKDSLQQVAQSSSILETQTFTLTVTTTAGSNIVTTTSNKNLHWWLRNQTITIGGVDYTIQARAGTKLILYVNPVVVTNAVATIKSSSNRYSNNLANAITLAPNGTSEILSTYTDSKITTVSNADYNATTASGIILYTTLTAARTVTLPTALTCKGKEIIIKDGAGTAGTNNITIDGFGTETIDGALTTVISTNYGKVKVKSTGTAWVVV